MHMILRHSSSLQRYSRQPDALDTGGTVARGTGWRASNSPKRPATGADPSEPNRKLGLPN